MPCANALSEAHTLQALSKFRIGFEVVTVSHHSRAQVRYRNSLLFVFVRALRQRFDVRVHAPLKFLHTWETINLGLAPSRDPGSAYLRA